MPTQSTYLPCNNNKISASKVTGDCNLRKRAYLLNTVPLKNSGSKHGDQPFWYWGKHNDPHICYECIQKKSKAHHLSRHICWWGKCSNFYILYSIFLGGDNWPTYEKSYKISKKEDLLDLVWIFQNYAIEGRNVDWNTRFRRVWSCPQFRSTCLQKESPADHQFLMNPCTKRENPFFCWKVSLNITLISALETFNKLSSRIPATEHLVQM